jgi:IS5 family transposase
MRVPYHKQLPLTPPAIAHVHAQELTAISALLDDLPEAVSLVHKDLTPRGVSRKKGREGMTAEQVLRAMFVKQTNGFSYDELAFHLADSQSYAGFCRYTSSIPHQSIWSRGPGRT